MQYIVPGCNIKPLFLKNIIFIIIYYSGDAGHEGRVHLRLHLRHLPVDGQEGESTAQDGRTGGEEI